MCELLGMSANVPTDIHFSLSGLIRAAAKPGRIKTGGELRFMKEWAAGHSKTPVPAATPPLPVLSVTILSNPKR